MKKSGHGIFLAWGLALSMGMIGCGGGDSTSSQLGGSFSLSGVLGAGLDGVARQALRFDFLTGLAPSRSMMVSSNSPKVDTVWALAIMDGEVRSWAMQYAIKATVDSAGKMSISIPKNQGNANRVDYVIVLIDSTQAEKIDQVVGYLSLSDAEDEGLLKMPGTDVTSNEVNVGTISQASGSTDARSSRSLSELSSNFNVDLSVLREAAKTDHILKSVKNVYANFVSSDQWSMSSPYFAFRGKMSDAINQFSSPSSSVTYSGYGLYFNVLHPGLNLEDLCSGSKILTLVPPTSISTSTDPHGNLSPTVFSSSSPLSNSGTGSITNTSSGSECGASSDGGIYIHNWLASGESSIGFNWGGGNGFSGGMASGIWHLYLAGTQIGAYDFGSVKVVDDSDNMPTVYVPAVKFTVDSSDRLTQIDVKMFAYDRTAMTFNEVTDLRALNQSVSSLNVGIDDYGNADGRKSENGQFTQNSDGTFTYKNFQYQWKKTDGSNWNAGTAQAPITSSIAVDYKMYGASMRFDFRTYY